MASARAGYDVEAAIVVETRERFGDSLEVV
jgi:hypothetical protein